MERAKQSIEPTASKEKRTTPPKRSPRLGRGLSSLMAHPVQVEAPSASEPSSTDAGQVPSHPTPIAATQGDLDRDGLAAIPIKSITRNAHQPRQQFSEEALKRLAASIRSEGLMQPIIVRPVATGSENDVLGSGVTKGATFELVAGERRWRAAELAGLATVPAIIRELDDQKMAQWALIENLQREDLNPMERASAFAHLMDQFGLSHDQIAQCVGVERPSVSNYLRLLTLCESAQQLIRDGLISAGQAKALLGVSDSQEQAALAHRVVARGWSVRQVEQEVRRRSSGSGSGPVGASGGQRSVANHLEDLERQIGQQLQTKVKIRPGRKKGSGTLAVEFYNLDQFDALMERLGIHTD